MPGTISTRIALSGADDVRRDLAQLGQTGEQALKRVQDASGNVKLNKLQQSAQNLGRGFQQAGQAGQQAGQAIGRSFADAGGQINKVETETSSLGSRFASLVGIVAGVGVAIAAAFGAAQESILKAGAASVGQMREQADKLGITTDELQRMRAEADEAGVDTDKLVQAMSRLDRELAKVGAGAAEAGNQVSTGLKRITFSANEAGEKVVSITNPFAKIGKSAQSIHDVGDKTVRVFHGMAKAADDAGPKAEGLAKALQDLGINASKFASLGFEGRVDELRKAIARTPESLKQVGAIAEILGPEFRSLSGFFELTAKDVSAAQKRMEETGRRLTESEVDNIESYKSAASDFDSALAATRDKIAAILAPDRTANLKWMTDLIDKNREYLLGLIQTAKQQITTFFESRFGPSPLEGLLQRLKAVAATVWPAIQAGAQATWAFLSKVFSGDFSGVWATLRAGGIAVWEGIKAAAVAAWPTIQAAALVAWEAIKGAAASAVQYFQSQFPTAAAVISGAFAAATAAVNALLFAFQTVGNQLDPIANLINRIFGTEFTGQQVLATGLVLKFTGAIDGLSGPLTLAAAALGALAFGFDGFKRTIDIVEQGIQTFIALIQGNFRAAFSGALDLVKTFAASVNDQLRSIGLNIDWGALGERIKRTLGGALDFIAGKVKVVADAINGLFGAAGAGQAAASDAYNDPAVSAPAMASGGHVRGPGGPRSDSILARLSNGEFVVNAAATRKWLPWLKAINGFQMPRMKAGTPAFSGGGLAAVATTTSGKTVNVNLSLGGNVFAMQADEHVAGALTRVATRSTMRSAGRKPGWAV